MQSRVSSGNQRPYLLKSRYGKSAFNDHESMRAPKENNSGRPKTNANIIKEIKRLRKQEKFESNCKAARSMAPG